MFDDNPKIVGNARENQENVEKARVIGHEYIGFTWIQTLQASDCDLDARKPQADLRPRDEISMRAALTVREKAGYVTADAPRGGQKEKTNYQKKLVKKKKRSL